MTGAVVETRLDTDEVLEWWRPLVQWVLCLPHLAVAGVLTALSGVMVVPIAVAVLVTGRVPARLAAFQVMTVRERVRCYSAFFVLRRSLPPFSFALSSVDPGDDPMVRVHVVLPRVVPRWSVLVRPFVLLPHLLVLLPIGVVMDACYVVWMALAAVNRGWPPGLRRLLVAIERWVGAVVLYALLVTDQSPAFGLRHYLETDVTGLMARARW